LYEFNDYLCPAADYLVAPKEQFWGGKSGHHRAPYPVKAGAG